MNAAQHDLDEALGLVLHISVLLSEDMEQACAALGLTPGRMRLLWVLQEDGPSTQRQIADAMGVTARHVTGLVDVLAETGFVRRDPHPSDRRAVVVSPTEHGAEILAQVEASRVELTHQLFGDLGEAEFAGLADGLRGLSQRLQALVTEAGR